MAFALKSVRQSYFPQSDVFELMDVFRMMVNHSIRIELETGIKRQVEYKAAWEGVPVIQLTKGETRGTSKLCPAFGERLQEDRDHKRGLWCEECKKWEDRDVVAIMNISYRGWLRFRQSMKGEAVESMVQESRKEGVIPKVDASKLSTLGYPPKT